MAGLLAVSLGVLNVKDFFFFGQGPSLSMPASVKPGLFQRMRRLVGSQSLTTMLVGTLVLAATHETRLLKSGKTTRSQYGELWETIVSGGRDKELKLWDTNSGELITTLYGHGRQSHGRPTQLRALLGRDRAGHQAELERAREGRLGERLVEAGRRAPQGVRSGSAASARRGVGVVRRRSA